MRALVLSLAGAAGALALFEVTMQPSPAERLELATIFLLMAASMSVVALWLPRISRRSPSIRLTVSVLSLASFLIVGAGAIAIANRMFISEHDLTLLLVILAFGVVSAVGFAVAVGRPMTADLNQLEEQAAGVADGELDNRLQLDRADEVGRLGEAIDLMVSRLDEMEHERNATREARQAFFAAVGHDLRTPLSSLRAAVEAMQDGLADDSDRYLESMHKDVTALSQLVDDVFLLARLDAGVVDVSVCDVDLAAELEAAAQVLRPLGTERDIRIDVGCGAALFVSADPAALGRVMRNLIDNAVRHAPAGSAVRVHAAPEEGQVEILVLDDGPGFGSEFVGSAFDRFTREDPARVRATGGSGLGLAIASGFVNAMDGEIWAETGPGGAVGVSLPAVSGVSPQASSLQALSGRS